MAFSSRLGSLCRKSFSQNIETSGQVPLMSMLNAVHYMSSSELFVGGLSYGVDDQPLQDAFSGFGDVLDGDGWDKHVCVLSARQTGWPSRFWWRRRWRQRFPW